MSLEEMAQEVVMLETVFNFKLNDEQLKIWYDLFKYYYLETFQVAIEYTMRNCNKPPLPADIFKHLPEVESECLNPPPKE